MSILWVKFVQCCKKQWKLITGFFVGIFAILLMIKRGPSKDMFRKKNEMLDKSSRAEEEARAKIEEGHKINLENFLSRNEQIKDEVKEKLQNLDKKNKKRVDELLSSDAPEEEIAAALKKLL